VGGLVRHLRRGGDRDWVSVGHENGAEPGEWHEPAYYAQPRRNPRSTWAVGLAVLLFIAAPVALLIALIVH
jgi:hypothetical protein